MKLKTAFEIKYDKDIFTYLYYNQSYFAINNNIKLKVYDRIRSIQQLVLTKTAMETIYK